MLCGIYGILPQVALWGKGKLCLKGTTQALMTHRSLQTFHENRKKTVVSREDKRVAEMRLLLSDITTKLERNIVEEKDIKIVSEIIEVIAQHSG